MSRAVVKMPRNVGVLVGAHLHSRFEGAVRLCEYPTIVIGTDAAFEEWLGSTMRAMEVKRWMDRENSLSTCHATGELRQPVCALGGRGTLGLSFCRPRSPLIRSSNPTLLESESAA